MGEGNGCKIYQRRRRRNIKESIKKVDVIDERIKTLLDDMAETMYAANGVGLAAPQVGV